MQFIKSLQKYIANKVKKVTETGVFTKILCVYSCSKLIYESCMTCQTSTDITL